jgi:hypothetical protein
MLILFSLITEAKGQTGLDLGTFSPGLTYTITPQGIKYPPGPNEGNSSPVDRKAFAWTIHWTANESLSIKFSLVYRLWDNDSNYVAVNYSNYSAGWNNGGAGENDSMTLFDPRVGTTLQLDVNGTASVYLGCIVSVPPNNIDDTTYSSSIYGYAISLVGDTVVRATIPITAHVVVPYYDELPDYYKLYINYPNPFNSKTRIRYLLPEPNRVSLKIYNFSGYVIETLVDEVQDAGYHGIYWNASNVASGVYFYRLIVVGHDGNLSYSDTKKMVLTK